MREAGLLLSLIFVLNALFLKFCVLTPAAKLSNHRKQPSACFKFRHKGIYQS